MQNSPHLLILSSEFPPGPGGIGSHAYHVARGLTELGWEVTVLASQDHASDEDISRFNQRQNFWIIRQPRPGIGLRPLVCYIKSSSVIKEAQPDLILASGQRETWMSAMLSRQFQIPWVAMGHGSEFLVGRNWEKNLTRRAFSKADAIVAVSQYTKKIIHECGIRTSHLEVIPNASDPDRFKPGVSTEAWREKLGISSGSVLLTVGSVTKRKAHDLVIRALPSLAVEFPSIVYLIAGNSILKNHLAELARSIGVEKHVQQLGYVSENDLPALYNFCDVYVLASRRASDGDVEGYGISVIEAALSGKPSVVSRDCGLEETVVDGKTGILVNQEDSNGIGKALISLLRDQALRKKMGDAALERARRECIWPLRIQKYDELLRSLIKKNLS